MGNWTLVIHGVGMHHNGKAEDAEIMSDEFVQRLLEKGQHVEDASFTSGGRYILPINRRKADD